MDRFILRFAGQGVAPDADLEKIRSTPSLTILDASSRMLLVQASLDVVSQLAEMLPSWTCTPEQTIPLPDVRPKIRSSR